MIICMCEYILRHKGIDLLFGLILISDIHRVIELYQCYCVCCVLNKCHKGDLSVLPSSTGKETFIKRRYPKGSNVEIQYTK